MPYNPHQSVLNIIGGAYVRSVPARCTASQAAAPCTASADSHSRLLLCVLQEVSCYGDGTVLQAVILFERHLLAGILCSRTPCSSRP